jgi:hypothetical protein
MADISIWQKTGHFYFALTEEGEIADTEEKMDHPRARAYFL